MGILDKLRNRNSTAYITVNSRRCVACWECYEACPRQVLGKIDFLGHRHIKIKNAAGCIGCMKCVKACSHGAISKIN
ncbi:MAG: ferredoxin family protein [Muribaculaceae bacterium]|nr:ferredoxin family protein [Muribaculaceae bacterium]